MLTVEKPSPNRLNIDLSGRLDAESMAKGLDELLAQSEGISNGKMLYRITEFALPSLAAIGVEFARLPRLFSLLGRFDRCAVLTDAAWLRTAAEIEGALFAGIEISAYPFDQEEQAERWLNAERSVNV